MKYDVISLEFKLPYALRIPDATFVVNLRKAQLCHIRIKTDLGRTEFQTEQALEQKLIWENYRGNVVRIEMDTLDGKKLSALETIFNEDASLLSYRIPVGYTSVDIVLQVPDGTSADEYRAEAIIEGSNIVRDFLLGYRKYSADHLIPDLRLEDIPMLDIRPGTMVEDNGNYEASFDDPTPRMRWERPERLFKDPLSEAETYEFVRWLDGGMQLPQSHRLLLLATERAHVYKDYASAVTFSQSALEVFLSEFIRHRAAKAGITHLTMRDHSLKPIVDALEGALLNHKLRRFIPEVTKAQIAGTAEYNKWHTDAYQLRNEIIHAGRTNVTEQQAEDAFNSVKALISAIVALP